MEGAGGLMVPITETYTTIDYIREHNLPLALVTNGQLGSISHTLLALEAIKTRQIKLKYVVYNPYFDEDKIIAEETQKYLGEFLKKNFPETEYLIMNK